MINGRLKRQIALLTAAALMLVSSVAVGETKITVTGTGEIQINADTALISLGVNARDKDVLKAQQKVNKVIAAIRKAVTAQGVKKADMNTDFINIYAIYDYQNDQEKLSAYNVSSALAIKVTDMDSVGAVIDAAFSAGANTLNGISFSASDTQEAKNKAMTAAVKDAKKRAEVLASAAGLKITGIESISEDGTGSRGNSGTVAAKGMDTVGTNDSGTVVQAGKIVVSATVSMTFTAE